MNRRIVVSAKKHTDGVSTPDLAAAKEHSDSRIVSETDVAKVEPKQKRFTFRLNMAKEGKKSNTNMNNRPARKIKLNRAYFNAGFEAQPTVNVKTLEQIKSEREEVKQTVQASTKVTKPDNNTTVSVNKNSVLTANVVTSPLKQTVSVNTTTNTRKLVTLSTKKNLMLPTIQLKRISAGNYSRSVCQSSVSGNVGISSVNCFQGPHIRKKKDKLPFHRQQSPAKRRKINQTMPPCTTITSTISNDHSWSPDFDMERNSLKQPPSPSALSIGAESDDELHNEDIQQQSDERVFISATYEPDQAHHGKMWGTKPDNVLNSNRSPVKNKWKNLTMSSTSGIDSSFDNDKLDVMSIIADDDLFQDEKPGKLKRSLSQDSIFGNSKNESRGDLRSLLKNTTGQVSSVHDVVGEIFTSNSLSKPYKIPVRKPDGTGVVNGIRHVTQRRMSGGFPTPNAPQPPGHGNNFPMRQPPPTVQLVNRIRQNIDHGNIVDAWLGIQELDKSRCGVEKRLLEQMLKVCEKVSCSNPSAALAEAVLGCIGIIERQSKIHPMDYVMTVLCLTRCKRLPEARGFYRKMRLPQNIPNVDTLTLFMTDFCKALMSTPEMIFEVIKDVITLPLQAQIKTNTVNACVATLISTSLAKLEEINPNVWDSLLMTLCKAPNRYVQAASQVHNLMTQCGIILGPTAVMFLIQLYQETHSKKLLLNLLSEKAAQDVLLNKKLPTNVAQYLLGPTVGIQEIEQCLSNIVKGSNLPSADLLQVFVQKAARLEEYNLIYQFFKKTKAASLYLPTPALKHIVDVLENWDTNPEASVEVYTALRMSKSVEKKNAQAPAASTVTPHNKFDKPPVHPKKPCHNFRLTGSCRFGEHCQFMHAQPNKYHSSSEWKPPVHDSHREALDKNVRSQESSSCQAKMRKGILGSPPTVTDKNPFATTEVVSSGFAPQHFNPNLLNQMNKTFGLWSQNPNVKGNNHRNAKFHGPPVSVISKPPPNPPPKKHVIPEPPNPSPLSPSPLKQNVIPEPPKSSPHTALPPKKHVISEPPNPSSHTPEKRQVGRSFSWEPKSDHQKRCQSSTPERSPSVQADMFERNNNHNNNGNKVFEKQKQIEGAIRSGDWRTVHGYYLECKKVSNKKVMNSDLLLFRNSFTKSGKIGDNFNTFVEFMADGGNSGRSSHSMSSNGEEFDAYDVGFLGCLAVSLMEKCLVLKEFDEGYQVLLTLHSNNISYFESGTNFGAYKKDIPAMHVALIAVKLCLNVENHGIQGAMVVLKACDFATPEDGEVVNPDDMEYRSRILGQLFAKLVDAGMAEEAYEIIQNLEGSTALTAPMYTRVFKLHLSQNEVSEAVAILKEMHTKEIDCEPWYEDVLKHCINTEQYNNAVVILREAKERDITFNGQVLRDMLKTLPASEELLARVLFEMCCDMQIYPHTFHQETPWLCELGCHFTETELILLIQNHLSAVQEHLTISTDELLSSVKDLQIVLFPRLATESGPKISSGIQHILSNAAELLVKVLQHSFNPPLVILEQSGEQFHKKILVERMSIYRWFNANEVNMDVSGEQGDDEDEVCSQISLGSDVDSDLGFLE